MICCDNTDIIIVISDAIHLRRVRKDMLKLPSTGVNEKLSYLFEGQGSNYQMHGIYNSASGHRRTYTMETTMPQIPRSVVVGEEVGETEEMEEESGNGSVLDNTPKEVMGKEISSRLRSKLADNNDMSGPVGGVGSKSKPRKRGAVAATNVTTNTLMAQEAADSTVSGSAMLQLGDNDRRRGKADKQEMKKKWTSIHNQATSLCSATKSVYGGTSRPTYSALLELLEDSYDSMPMPSDMVLDDAVYRNLKESMLELIEVSVAIMICVCNIVFNTKMYLLFKIALINIILFT